jgi:hypothetical protein
MSFFASSISLKLGLQKMTLFSLTPILRIELAPRRGERQICPHKCRGELQNSILRIEFCARGERQN